MFTNVTSTSHLRSSPSLLVEVPAEKPEWLSEIVEAVSEVTQIAQADDYGQIGEFPLCQHGVAAAPTRALGVCSSMTTAPYAVTTEVCSDSPGVSAEQCVRAQVAAVCAALNHVRRVEGL